MKKILAFGASNSSSSINKQFAAFVASQLNKVEVALIDLNDYEMPLFGVDKEKEIGSPPAAKQLLELIADHDALVISLAEHNSNYTVAFKNAMDWMSRLEGKLWQNKPMFLLSTSPGKRGGKNAMGIALKFFPFHGANIIANFSLPSFHQNFTAEKGISDDELGTEFEHQLAIFQEQINLPVIVKNS